MQTLKKEKTLLSEIYFYDHHISDMKQLLEETKDSKIQIYIEELKELKLQMEKELQGMMHNFIIYEYMQEHIKFNNLKAEKIEKDNKIRTIRESAPFYNKNSNFN